VKSLLLLIVPVACGLLSYAQSVTNSYTTDINGRRVEGPSVVATDGERTQITRSINGRQVPMEQTVERVISDGPSGRVVERVTKRFDPNGQNAATERVVIEQQKTGNGLHERQTVYYGDASGQMREIERRVTDTKTQGSVTNSQTDVARPGVDGSFQTVEKRSAVAETSGGDANGVTRSDQTVYRRSGNGDFYPAVRDVSEVTKNGSQVTEKSAHYEPRSTSALTLIGQTVSSTATRADGSSVSQVELYGLNAGDGRVHDNETAPHLREVQTIERTVGAGGSVTEVVSAQRPTVSDPSRMGPSRVISETVCTGKCSGSSGH
jgi:hypothetical protein